MSDAVDTDTPEARLLARKGSTAYLEDVRSLVTRAEQAEAAFEDAMTLLEEHRTRLEEADGVVRELGAEVERLRRGSLAATVGQIEVRDRREFGSIRTRRHDGD
jgi:hypothetical protein